MIDLDTYGCVLIYHDGARPNPPSALKCSAKTVGLTASLKRNLIARNP
jgi:hypothetical protein